MGMITIGMTIVNIIFSIPISIIVPSLFNVTVFIQKFCI